MQEVLNLIGYYIGGTKIGIGIGNSNGEIYAKARIEIRTPSLKLFCRKWLLRRWIF